MSAVIALLTVAPAAADPCEAALSALARGAPPGAVARVARSDAWDPDTYGCLLAAAPPRRVVIAAARAGGMPVPERPHRFELGADAVAVAAQRGELEPVGAVGAHAAWLPADRVAVEATVAVSPDRRGGIGGRSAELRFVHRSAVDLQLAPLSGRVWADGAAWRVRGFVAVGVAAVATVDDPDGALHLDGDDRFDATQRQTHPALHWGAAVRLDPPRGPQLRLGVDQSRWVEVVRTTWLDTRALTLVQLGVVARLP